jgi:hypothetical protein
VSRQDGIRSADGGRDARPSAIEDYAPLFDLAWFLSPRPIRDQQGAQQAPHATLVDVNDQTLAESSAAAHEREHARHHPRHQIVRHDEEGTPVA